MAKIEELKKYLTHEFSSGSYTGEDYRTFQTKYINYLKAICRENHWQLVNVGKNHYCFSAFIKSAENKCVYLSISDVRYFTNEWYGHPHPYREGRTGLPRRVQSLYDAESPAHKSRRAFGRSTLLRRNDMKLNLQATTKEERKVKAYLAANASEVLAEKINNGVKIQKDGKTLLNKKTLAGFLKYACDEAKKQAEKGASSACIDDDTVYGWAVHYFEEDSIEGTLYNEDGTEYKAPMPKVTAKVPTVKTATEAADVHVRPVGRRPRRQARRGKARRR